MEKRAIQITGGSSYNVTLPKSWIVQQSIHLSKSVEIHELSTGQLVISPHKPTTNTTARLNIMYLKKRHVVREMISLFIAGFDEILVTSQKISNDDRSLIRTISFKLFGFEIFDEQAEYILLKNVATTTISPKEHVIRMFAMTKTMYLDMIAALQTNDKRLARDIIDRDTEIDKTHLIILRQFKIALKIVVPINELQMTTLELSFLEHVAIRIERIADHIVRIAETIINMHQTDTITFNKQELAKIRKVEAYFSFAQDGVLKINTKLSHQLLDIIELLPRPKQRHTHLTTKPIQNTIIHNSVERIISYLANIAEEIINYSNVRPDKL